MKFSKLRKIERLAYPAHMWQMQDVYSIKDLAEYCECSVSQVFCIIGEDYYLIAANKKRYIEIVDLASIGGIGGDVFRIMNKVSRVSKGKKIILDARETTSYPLVKLFARRYLLQIVEDKEWMWGDEVMHSMVLK